MADESSVIVTAGYDRSPVAAALIQALPREGVTVAGAILVSPVQRAQVVKALRQGGFGAVMAGARKALGIGSQGASRDDPVERYFAAEGFAKSKVSALAKAAGIPLLHAGSLADRTCAEFVRAIGPTGAIYAGGGIIRSDFLDAAGGKVLNAHAGPLPEVRGMNAVEWTILLGMTPCVTIHFVDAGIDTGPQTGIVCELAVEPGETIDRMRRKSLVASIEGLRMASRALRDPVPPRSPHAADHKQYYAMHDLLRTIAERKLLA